VVGCVCILFHIEHIVHIVHIICVVDLFLFELPGYELSSDEDELLLQPDDPAYSGIWLVRAVLIYLVFNLNFSLLWPNTLWMQCFHMTLERYLPIKHILYIFSTLYVCHWREVCNQYAEYAQNKHDMQNCILLHIGYVLHITAYWIYSA
jgi:hypothetical protein